MAEDLKKLIKKLMEKIPGLYAVIISDREGVPVLKTASDKAPELRPPYISTFGLAIDQGSKLGLGKTKTLICSYSQYQIVQMNKLPLIVTFVASDSCNTGHILALETQIEPILTNLKIAVAET